MKIHRRKSTKYSVWEEIIINQRPKLLTGDPKLFIGLARDVHWCPRDLNQRPQDYGLKLLHVWGLQYKFGGLR